MKKVVKNSKMTEKVPNRRYISRIKLYKASSRPPVTIDNVAKEEIYQQKRYLEAPEDSFLRIDARCVDLDDGRQLEIYFDTGLDKEDMVYLDNNLLFAMDLETSTLLSGRTLSYYKGDFELLANGITQIYTEPGDLPQC